MLNGIPYTAGHPVLLVLFFFVNADTGFVVADGGVILKTINAGETWGDPLPSGTTNDLYCVYFTSPDTGYAVGDAGTILKTTNGGTTWASQSSGTAFILINVFFIGDIGYIAGDGTTLLKTIDGGQNWTPIINGAPDANYKAVYFINADTGFAVSNKANIIKTIDGGSDWYVVYTELNNSYFSVFFTSAQIGYVAGDDQTNGEILKTTDGGETWRMIEDITCGNLKRVYFPDSIAGWAVSRSGDIIQTSDAGETWNLQQSGTSEFLFGLFFINEDIGYAVGSNGTILKTTNGGFPVGINEKQHAGSLIISPNPSREKIIIEFSELVNSMNGTVSIYEMTGQELIKQQVNGSKVELNVNSLPQGIYFIRLMNSEKTGFGKFIKE